MQKQHVISDCSPEAISQQVTSILDAEPDFSKVTGHSELKILAVGYCHTMLVGPTLPIYDLVRDFEKSLGASFQNSQRDVFFEEIKKLALRHVGQAPRLESIVAEEYLAQLESLDVEDTWGYVCHTYRYMNLNRSILLQKIMYFKEQRLVALSVKIRMISGMVSRIRPLWFVLHYSDSIVLAIRSPEDIEQSRKRLMVQQHQDQPTTTTNSIIGRGIVRFIDLFESKTKLATHYTKIE